MYMFTIIRILVLLLDCLSFHYQFTRRNEFPTTNLHVGLARDKGGPSKGGFPNNRSFS